MLTRRRLSAGLRITFATDGPSAMTWVMAAILALKKIRRICENNESCLYGLANFGPVEISITSVDTSQTTPLSGLIRVCSTCQLIRLIALYL